jgi:hypothetical protein
LLPINGVALRKFLALSAFGEILTKLTILRLCKFL